MNKPRKIKEQISTLDQNLAAAKAYVARNVNVWSFSSWFHLKDYKGKSGHPLWMKNHMIPSTERALAGKERALKRIAEKSKRRRVAEQRRPK